MSFAVKNIHSFVQLLEESPSLFSNKKTELIELLETIDDNQEKLSDTILQWSEKYTDIDEALGEKRRLLFPPNITGEALPGRDIPNLPPIPENINKDMLLTYIKRSSNNPTN